MSRREVSVFYDIDDVQVEFNTAFIPWVARETDIVLGELSSPYDFDYRVRFPDAVHSNGLAVDWDLQIHNFTVKDSVDLLTPKPGAVEHFEAIHSHGLKAVAITSRPGGHRSATQQLLSLHFGDYYRNFADQLIMPDELKENGHRPSKPSIAHKLGGVALVEDAIHNLEPTLAMETAVQPILYTDETTTWNHQNVPEGIHVAEGWHQVSVKISQLVSGPSSRLSKTV